MITILPSIPICRYHSRPLTSLWMGKSCWEVSVTTHFDWYTINCILIAMSYSRSSTSIITKSDKELVFKNSNNSEFMHCKDLFVDKV